MELTQEQQQALYEDGYVKFPGIVPKELVHEALRAINSSLGSNGIDPQLLTTFRSQSFCPELRESPSITNLLNESPLWGLAESAIGTGKIKPINSGR